MSLTGWHALLCHNTKIYLRTDAGTNTEAVTLVLCCRTFRAMTPIL